MNDHIKGIRSKIQEFGGFRVSTSAEATTVKSMEETVNKVTTKKPLGTTKVPNKAKPEKPLVIDHENVSISQPENVDQNGQMATTHDAEHETVEVNASPAEASIAEAKPVGEFFYRN